MSNLPIISGLAAGSFLLTAAAIPFLKRLAWSFGLVDDPTEAGHKSHGKPIPYGGGMAIYLGVLFPVIVALLYALRQFVRQADGSSSPRLMFSGVDEASMLLGCASILFLIGLIDDWKGLTLLPRFLIEIATAVILVLECPEFRFAGDAMPLLGGALSVIWIVAITNAFNFLDNMDGLTAGMAIISTFALSALALLIGHLPAAVLGFVLVGALVGFLCYNFPPASVFMGDAGGLFLGFVAGGLSLLISHHASLAFVGLPPLLAPLLTLAVPAYDLVSVVLIRVGAGFPVWRGDNNHISHRLVRKGLSRRGAVLVIYLLTLLTSLPAVLVLRVPPTWSWAMLAVVVTFIAVGAHVEVRDTQRQRSA